VRICTKMNTMPTRTPTVGPQIPLRELRKACGLTLPQLADRIAQCYHHRPNEGTLANIELGRQFGSRKLMTAWAMALQLSPLVVLQEDDLRHILAASNGKRQPRLASPAEGDAA
jgi:transcriptional regulator with XRE-family HTH domain